MELAILVGDIFWGTVKGKDKKKNKKKNRENCDKWLN